MASSCEGFGPSSRVAGEVEVPTSKSIAQRLVICAALCGERVHVVRLPDGEDVQHLLRALEGWGVQVRRPGPRAATITGRPPGPHRGLQGIAMVGESGTAARLLTAVGGLCGASGQEVRVEAGGSLLKRSSPALFAALRSCGVQVEGDGWPASLGPIGPPSELTLVEPSSSQEVSGLWIALAAWPGEHLMQVRGRIPSQPYLELTRAALAEFGASVEEHPGAEGQRGFLVRGPLRAPSAPLEVETDASAAAVALAAGCLSGGRAQVAGLGPESRQGDVAIVRWLEAFGCRAGFEGGGAWAEGLPQHGAELDLGTTPDLAPVLVAVAAAAARAGGGPSLLTGLETLPGKESSRIEVLAQGLRAVGYAVEDASDRMRIEVGSAREVSGPVLLDPHGDHRMAFAFGLLGLLHEGVWVRNPGCVGKSWPSFWQDLRSAGAQRPQAGPPSGYAAAT